MTLERNDRIRHAGVQASDASLALLKDKERYSRIQLHAIETVGQLYDPRPIPDLALKIVIARAFLGVLDITWPARLIGHVIYGGDSPSTGAPKMTRMQQGEPVSQIAAAMLAQFFNYFLDDPVDMQGWPRENVAAEIAGWIETNSGFDWGLRASDFAGDPLALCGRLESAVLQSGVPALSALTKGEVHERLVSMLFTPLRHASWDTRLVIGDGRLRSAERDRYRFGRDLKVGSDPEGWRPIEISSPDWILEYGLPKRTEQPLRAWLATVRDPSWKDINGTRDPSRSVWKYSWDQLIRWLPGFRIAVGEQIAAPTSNENTLDGLIPGLYRVFLFVEPDDGAEEVARALWNEADRPAHDIPDEVAYVRLCEALEQPELTKRASVFAGAYVVPG